MKKKTKVIIAALAVLLLAVTCVTVAFLMKDEKHGTLAANTGIEAENPQDKELDGKPADTEIKTTSEKTTEASTKEKEKVDKQDKTTEASVTTEKPGTTEASVQGLPTASTTTEKPRTTEETPATMEKPHTTEAPATTEKPNATEAPAPAHVHSWKTINHPAETHKEKQLVCEAYDEDIYEYHVYCNACGTYLENMSSQEMYAHAYTCSSGYTGGTIKVGTVHHDAEYETVTVVDKEAWTETVCETCGERK